MNSDLKFTIHRSGFWPRNHLVDGDDCPDDTFIENEGRKEMITEWTTNSLGVNVSSPEDGSAQLEPQLRSTLFRPVHLPLLLALATS